jgi:hypothetical protein
VYIYFNTIIKCKNVVFFKVIFSFKEIQKNYSLRKMTKPSSCHNHQIIDKRSTKKNDEIELRMSKGENAKTIQNCPLTLVLFFFLPPGAFLSFHYTFQMKKTYLSPINLVMTNESYKKIKIPLKANVKFFGRKI